MTPSRLFAKLALPVLVAAWGAPAEAQERALSFDARGGYSFPMSDFGDTTESDFGFGAGIVFSLTSSFGLYGGWARDAFGCEDTVVCDEDSQIHVQGFEAGVKFLVPTEARILPWLKAGLIAHEMKFDTGTGLEAESDREYGFQAAAGVDFPLGEVVSVSPGLRFNMIEMGDDDAFETEVRYLSFDLGLHFHIPRN
jgi:opacity protein-like surface antigen